MGCRQQESRCLRKANKTDDLTHHTKKDTASGQVPPLVWRFAACRLTTGSPRTVPKGRNRPGLPQEGPVQTPQGRVYTHIMRNGSSRLIPKYSTPRSVGSRFGAPRRLSFSLQSGEGRPRIASDGRNLIRCPIRAVVSAIQTMLTPRPEGRRSLLRRYEPSPRSPHRTRRFCRRRCARCRARS